MIPVIIVGKIGSGKTFIADYLVQKYKYKKHSMATWLKNIIHNHYNIQNVSKSLIIKNKPIREYYQTLGESLRRIDPMWHIDETIRKIKESQDDNVFVIDDIRYINELDEIRRQFKCISIKVSASKETRLERVILRDMIVPTESQLTDISEIELEDIITDFAVDNNSTIENLIDSIEKIIRKDAYEKFRNN